MATTLNKLKGQDKDSYKTELMQENTVLFSKVKELADNLMMQEYLTALLNGDTKGNTHIWAQVVNSNPELLEDLMEEYNSQLTYKTQASAYAYKLLQTYGKPQHDKLMAELKENTPVEFRKMVMAEFQNMVAESMGSKKQIYDEAQVSQIAGEINAVEDVKQKQEIIQAMKQENPELYSKVIIKIDIQGENDGKLQ